MKQKVMQRLIWKDARTISPLFYAMVIAILAFNGLIALYFPADDLSDARERFQLARSVWILLPNLLAFGAPAMLIGGEEESGSLAWLRTLPASWISVSTSKLVVAFTGLAALWAFSSFLYWLHAAISPENVIEHAKSFGFAPDWSAPAVLTQLCFSAALLLTSLCLSYFFRSPINALLAVLPAMVLFTVVFVNIESYLFETRGGISRWRQIPVQQLWAALSFSGTVFLVTLGLLHQWIARRRLAGPEERILRRRVEQSVSVEAFRPPSPYMSTWYGASLAHCRPSKTGALLWQTTRPYLGSLLVLTVIAAFSISLAVLAPRSSGELAGLIAGLACFTIVGMTFYGDSVRNRCVFLSDRGISNSLIWRTRLIPTAASFALIIAAMLLSAQFTWRPTNDLFFVLTLLVVGYCLCQLVSQWAPRPVFSFLAGPIFGMLAILAFMPLYDFYREGALLAVWLAVPILLFASWQLMPHWVSGSKQQGYTLRFTGYLLAALIVPHLVIYGIRAATIPADDPQWRARVLAFDMPSRPADLPLVEIFSPRSAHEGILYSYYSLEHYLERQQYENFEKRFEQEMAATDSVGNHVRMEEIVARMPSWPHGINTARTIAHSGTGRKRMFHRDSELRMARLLLKWSRMVREQAQYGDATLEQLNEIAEMGEHIVTVVLEDHLDPKSVNPEIQEVIQMFPSDDLVVQSRLNTLIRSYQDYRRRRGISPLAAFARGSSVDRPLILPWLEDLRRDRFIDQTIRLAEQNWRNRPAIDADFVHSAHQANLAMTLDGMIRNRASAKIESLKKSGR